VFELAQNPMKIQPNGDTMIKRQLGALFLVTCLILTTVPAVLCAQSTITVNPTSGTNAQTAINSAINSVASGATPSNPGYVLLSAGTYKISGPISLKSNVVIKGAGDGTIIFATGSVCNSAEAPAYIFGSGISNAEISSLQFQSTATKISDGGHGEYRNCIKFSSCSNCKVHDILFTKYLYNDGVRIGKSSGMQVYNCRMHSVGHDGIEFLSDSHDCRAYNNDIDIMVNTGIRVDNGKNIELDHNTMYGNHGSGWCCFEMESSLSNINIHHNILHDYRGSSGSAAVQPVHASGNVNVHENVLWNVGPISMGSGSGNIINPSDRSVDNWVAKGYGYGSIDKPKNNK
jgi:Pectate lyase superfamily protein